MGCGPSCCAQEITQGTKWYLDPLLNEYKSLFPEVIPQGEYLCTNIEDSSLQKDFFDIIIALNSFDHVQDPWKALELIYAALKPGGLFAFSIYTRKAFLAMLRNLQEYLNLSTDSAHPYTFTKERMIVDLERAKFVIESCHVVQKDKDRVEYLWICKK